LALVLKPQKLIEFLEENGYRFVRNKGSSHKIYSNGIHSVPIAAHGNKDFGENYVRMVLRETGLTKAELLKYLKR
jgi:predicted RNA binding protein YcfA (HicA-like mRNA interferase family)